jgi:hypothetical protein
MRDPLHELGEDVIELRRVEALQRVLQQLLPITAALVDLLEQVFEDAVVVFDQRNGIGRHDPSCSPVLSRYPGQRWSNPL